MITVGCRSISSRSPLPLVPFSISSKSSKVGDSDELGFIK